jgi:hypothetical protein
MSDEVRSRINWQAGRICPSSGLRCWHAVPDAVPDGGSYGSSVYSSQEEIDRVVGVVLGRCISLGPPLLPVGATCCDLNDGPARVFLCTKQVCISREQPISSV